MSLMLDLVAAGVFVADVPTFGACRFTFMNAALAPLAGLSERAGAGCTLEELFDPDRAACYTKHLHACAESRAPLEYEDSVPLPSGRRWLQVTLAPFTDCGGRGEGGPPRVVGTVIDVTARKRAELSNRAKSTFLASMSHELRTPLNAIIGFAEIIGAQMFGPISNPKYVEYANDILFSGSHLLDLINDVLDISKIEAGKLALAERVIEIGPLFDAVTRIMAERAGAAGVALVTEIQRGLAAVRGDERLLRQVLINLLANAVKFSSPGDRILLIALELADGQLALCISDTGTGIATAELARALEPYGQAGPDGLQRRSGTGLGLPLAKAMIEAHGGSLFINSELGAGTTVFVTLPVDRVVRPADAGGLQAPPSAMDVFSIDGRALGDTVDSISVKDLDALPVGVIQLDRDGRILRYNAAESRFSGLTADQVIGRDFFREIAPCTRHPDFYGRFREGVEAGHLNALFEYVFEFQHRRMKVWIQMKTGRDPDTVWVFVRWV
jgi:photoactive yellow protein